MSSSLGVSMKQALISLPIALVVGFIPAGVEAAQLTWQRSNDSVLLGRKVNSVRHTFKGAGAFGDFRLSDSNRGEEWEIILSVANNRRLPQNNPSKRQTIVNRQNIQGNIQIIGLDRASKQALKDESSLFAWRKDNQLSVVVPDGNYRVKASNNLTGRREQFKFQAQSVPEPFSTAAAVGLAIAGVSRTLKRKKNEKA